MLLLIVEFGFESQMDITIFMTFFAMAELSGFYWFLFGFITDIILLFTIHYLLFKTVVNSYKIFCENYSDLIFMV